MAPRKIFLGFYKGRGRIDDRVIRWATRSAYSHCELVFSPSMPQVGETHHCLSSSGRDGGVRSKDITFDANKWDFIDIPWAPSEARIMAARHLYARYDYPGILLSHVFPLNRHSAHRWFCSELCAYALGLPTPHEWSPGRLHRTVVFVNQLMAAKAA